MKIFFLSGLLFSLFCTSSSPFLNTNIKSVHWHLVKPLPVLNPAFKGLYQGYFGQSPIEINLEAVDDNGIASGYSLHKGLKRPLKGTWEAISNSSKAKFMLHEPGDNKFDGHFEIQIDSVTYEGEGVWYPKAGSGLGEVIVTIKKQ